MREECPEELGKIEQLVQIGGVSGGKIKEKSKLDLEDVNSKKAPTKYQIFNDRSLLKSKSTELIFVQNKQTLDKLNTQ